ncbi:MAG TPA: exo-alpha-sialidase [Firmicutes bacterium]|nr:exo-alpha-sialidase [Bacillota bacterium]
MGRLLIILAFNSATRKFEGIPSICYWQGGLFATWYAGVTPGEDQNNYVVLASSDDHGLSWRDIIVVDPDGNGPVRAYDPQIWADPDGRLWFFWAQQVSASTPAKSPAELWEMHTMGGSSSNPQWSAPSKIANGVMMGKPIVLSTGEWCLPVSVWMQPQDSAQCVVSTDHGQTWQVRGACDVPVDVRTYDEHRILEKQDGSLLMWVRTRYGIGESMSYDKGYTWSRLVPAAIKHTNSRFFLGRLSSGRLILVKNGQLTEDCGRANLTAYVSTDDGRTWPYGLLLDERKQVSYPDVTQSPDGTIFIIYDFDRTGARDILLARLTELDIMRGEMVAAQSRLRMKVNGSNGSLNE